MSFIQRELERIQSALGKPGDEHYEQLWAAQQALAWALEPTGFKSPFCAITGSREALRGYSEGSRLPPLSGTSASIEDVLLR